MGGRGMTGNGRGLRRDEHLSSEGDGDKPASTLKGANGSLVDEWVSIVCGIGRREEEGRVTA